MIASSLLAAGALAAALVSQAAGLPPALDRAVAGREARSAAPAAAPLPPSMMPRSGWSTDETRPLAVRRAHALADSGRPDASAQALRRVLAGLTGRERARVLFDLGLVETGPASSVDRLSAAADSDPQLRAAAWLAAGEALMVAGYPAAARGWLGASRGLKQGVASERAAFLLGAALLQEGEPVPARTAFSDYLVDYLSGTWQPAARIGIAVANEQLGRRREAAEIYRAILAQHRGYEDEPWVMNRLAELLDTESPDEAVRLRARLAEEYPGASGASPARPSGASPAAGTAASRAPLPASTPRPIEPSARPSPSVGASGGPSTASSSPSTTPTASPRTPPAAPRAEVWSLQAGAFQDAARADQQRRRFTARGWTATIARRGELHVVYAGSFASKAAAEASRAEAGRIADLEVFPVRR